MEGHLRFGKKFLGILILAIFIFGSVVAIAVHTVPNPSQKIKMQISDQPPIGWTSIQMTIIGDTQGIIEGEGIDNSILVESLIHQIYVPYDNDTGQPQASGKRVHNPLVIHKIIDKSSPKLAQALISNEELNIQIRWYRIDPSNVQGAWQQYYTMNLTGAKIVSIITKSPGPIEEISERPVEDVSFEPSEGPALYGPLPMEEMPSNYGHVEEIAFTYSSITWNYELLGGYESSDNWYQPDIP